MYVQEVLQTLNRFWVERGALLWQPYHTEVGAGTSNPATFLRALGPEPWWVAYMEPSCRPADGRYAENPNRLQHYYQYQVILKPSPQNVQELYLQSFEALGLDLTKHDFRFVEDNWQSPSLGAWGLGWEAWLDGMEVLQFTYFQECGGLKLDVRACELTYGIERICMYLQGKETVYDLEWAPNGITYGDIYKKSEIEYCTYNFEEADAAKLFSFFDQIQDEGLRLLDKGLILPAYDHCLRLSHLFNVLDARGAFSVSERGRYLLRCRTIAEESAKQFFNQREEMKFPLMRLPRPISDPPAPTYDFDAVKLKETDTLLVEFGVEELPHKDVTAVCNQAVALTEKLFAAANMAHGAITLWTTPRRITLRIEDVPARQPDVQTEARGPKAAAAKDKDGNWTMPAVRFAESKGATPDQIEFRSAGKDEYCFLNVVEKGKTIAEFLESFVGNFLGGLNFVKSMGWEDTTVTFSRPVRWLIALHGDTVIPAKWKTRDASEIGPERFIYTDRLTYGHRRLAPGAIEIANAGAYLDALHKAHVIADRDARMAQLRTRAEKLAKDMGLVAEMDDELLEEICDLTEWPEPIVGSIPEDALTLPEAIIITPMKIHQRYIPIRKPDGTLSQHFLCVANGEHSDEGKQVIATGNERVLNARLRDAKYFWDADIDTPLDEFAAKLTGITFHQKLGSVADKVERLKKLYAALADKLPSVDTAKMDRVLTLMKADLTTQMVFEFDSLEGVVGKLYAEKQGINPDIALAMLEHRLPRRADDGLPTGDLGRIAGVLDRFDTLAGYFGIGTKVKGASDPFGLRRNALGLLNILQDAGWDLDLRVFAEAALTVYGDLVDASPETLDALLGFFTDRESVALRDAGFAYDYVAAAINSHALRPAQARKCVEALATLSPTEVQNLAEQTKRMARIIKEPADTLDANLVAPEEQGLYGLLDGPAKKAQSAAESGDFGTALGEMLTWLPAIESYFEKVMVNDKDDAVRKNRHALLRDALAAIQSIADLTAIEKKDVAAA